MLSYLGVERNETMGANPPGVVASWEQHNGARVEVSKGPVRSAGHCQPKILACEYKS